MNNIVTIYRFNTPFLNISEEKDNLISLVKKIEKSIEFDWINFKQIRKKEWNYHKISLLFEDDLWKVDFYYISRVWSNVYHLPLFKLNIFLRNDFLVSEDYKKRVVDFLNNIFECFDWLNEKEFLIDINPDIYYKKGLFWFKKYPVYDFYDIEKARELFENKWWIEVVEDFIKKFSKKNFELTKEKAEYYHTLHWIFLYFIYLVFILYQNISNTSNAKKQLKEIIATGIYEWQIDLMNKRLSYVEDIHTKTFEKYKNRLELFFKLFD